jgi:hypothetical protein
MTDAGIQLLKKAYDQGFFDGNQMDSGCEPDSHGDFEGWLERVRNDDVFVPDVYRRPGDNVVQLGLLRRNADTKMYNNEEMVMMDKKELLEAQAMRLLDQLAKLQSRPSEPVSDDPDGANVVWFKKRFSPSSTEYTYTAVKAGGSWYLSGPTQVGTRYSWDDLCDFVFKESDANDRVPRPVLWVASSWEELT